jgi:hypothetical protein
MLAGECVSHEAKDSRASSSTHWQYTALGDSLAVGVLDSQGGYVRPYDADISTDTGVTVSLTDLGVNGAHSGDLLKNSGPQKQNLVSMPQEEDDVGCCSQEDCRRTTGTVGEGEISE